MTPNLFTEEYLTGLKFKELQKLSVQFRVNKRWAKKQELIENLLALKNKKNSLSDSQEEEEWKDGSIAFNDFCKSSGTEESRRLTFNVNTKSNSEDPHSTLDFSQNGKKFLGETANSRETYDVLPSKIDLGVEALIEARATFEIPPKKQLIDDFDPRATFDIPQNGMILLEESEMETNKLLKNSQKDLKESKKKINDSGFQQDVSKLKFDISIKKEKLNKNPKPKQQVKTLTIPYARITRRTRQHGELATVDNSLLKMSEKSVNIKKCTTRLPVTKNSLVKSPSLSSVKKSINKQTIIQSLLKTQPVTKSRLPVRLDFNTQKLTEKPDDNDKENIKKSLRKRSSKTTDEILIKKPNSVKVNFRTPPPSASKNSKTMALKKTPLRKETKARLNIGLTPENKPKTKLITATKMPDFNKIHKRQFDQMDSLHDYLKKKDERIRKLFGTPQPRQQLQALNKSETVFQFRSTTEEGNKGSETLKSTTTHTKQKESVSKKAQKEAFRSKLPPSKLPEDIKDKNRSHIHGVRTNKRFELQLKFRNI